MRLDQRDVFFGSIRKSEMVKKGHQTPSSQFRFRSCVVRSYHFFDQPENLSWLSSEQPAPHNFNFGQVGLEAIFFYQPKHLSWSSASQLNLCNFNLGQVGLFGFSKIKKLHRLKSTTEKTKKKCWMKGYIQRLLLQKKSQGQWMRKEKKYIHF